MKRHVNIKKKSKQRTYRKLNILQWYSIVLFLSRHVYSTTRLNAAKKNYVHHIRCVVCTYIIIEGKKRKHNQLNTSINLKIFSSTPLAYTLYIRLYEYVQYIILSIFDEFDRYEKKTVSKIIFLCENVLITFVK